MRSYETIFGVFVCLLCMDFAHAEFSLAALLSAPPPPASSVRIQPELSFSVSQGGWTRSRASSARPLLWSGPASPCILLALFNPRTREAALAHIDHGTDIRSIDGMITKLSRGGQDILDLSLAGGLIAAPRLEPDLYGALVGRLAKFQEHLRLRYVSGIKEGEQTPTKPWASYLAIDARNGTVFTNPHSSSWPTERWLGSDPSYRARESLAYSLRDQGRLVPLVEETPYKLRPKSFQSWADGSQ